jgi:glycosyltransferase involved in cell wall biosynthesis
LKEPLLKAFQFIEGGARYGAAVSVMNIAEGMRQCNVDVEFGVFAGRPLGEALRERGFVVHEIPANRRFDVRGIASLVKLIRAKRFDIIHTHLSRATVIGIFASRLTRTPMVATVHGMNRKFTYMFADHVMTVSEAAKRHLVDQGVPASRITAVYNAIKPEALGTKPEPLAAKTGFGFGPDSVVIGTVSRAHHQKGIDIAIKAVEEIRRRGMDAKYLFIGDGPHLDQFRQLAQQLEISEHVFFPGYSQRVIDALAAMDVFMFPTRREAFGISLLEAMSAEVPIVASAVDGVPEVLGENSGLLVEDHSPTAFADAAQVLITDTCRRRDIVKNARSRVETVFSVEQTARAVEQVYRRTILEYRSGRTARLRTRSRES